MLRLTKLLFQALQSHNKEEALAYISQGAQVNQTHWLGQKTPLMLAVALRDYDVAKALLEKGADVNKQDENGETALMKAVNWNDVRLVKLLCAQENIDLTHRDNLGRSALDFAYMIHNREIEAVLLKAMHFESRNVFSKEDELFSSVRAGNAIKVEELIKEGVNVNAREEINGNTPVMMAVAWDRTDILSQLQAAGADMNLQDNSGKTVLMKAVIKNDVSSMLIILQDSNIRFDLKDNTFHTVFDYVQMMPNQQLRNLFQRLFKVNSPKKCLFKQELKRRLIVLPKVRENY